MGLGSVKAFTLKEARERARRQRQLLADGIDPIEHRLAQSDLSAKEARERITFKQATEEFLAVHEATWKNAKHRRSSLQAHAFPILGEYRRGFSSRNMIFALRRDGAVSLRAYIGYGIWLRATRGLKWCCGPTPVQSVPHERHPANGRRRRTRWDPFRERYLLLALPQILTEEIEASSRQMLAENGRVLTGRIQWRQPSERQNSAKTVQTCRMKAGQW